MSSSDPAGLISDPPSTIVKIQNTSREELNGKLGIAVQYIQDRGRYLILITSSQQTMALKPENVVKASTLDTYRAHFEQLTKDPRVRQEITKYYNLAQSKLPARVKPEYAAGLFLLILAVLMYSVGFTKILMVISVVLLLGLIIAPDVSAPNASFRSVATNFPMRCREQVEMTAPFLRGRVTNQMAAGLVFVMIFFAGRALFATTPPKVPTATAATSATASSGNLADLQAKAYRLGYDDANNGKEFGHSLPLDAVAATSAGAVGSDGVTRALGVEHEPPVMIDYAPPKPAWYQKFGIRQIMSLFYLYRTFNEMGRDAHGTFSTQLLMANMHNMEIWKWGILGFSVYGLLQVFM